MKFCRKLRAKVRLSYASSTKEGERFLPTTLTQRGRMAMLHPRPRELRLRFSDTACYVLHEVSMRSILPRAPDGSRSECMHASAATPLGGSAAGSPRRPLPGGDLSLSVESLSRTLTSRRKS